MAPLEFRIEFSGVTSRTSWVEWGILLNINKRIVPGAVVWWRRTVAACRHIGVKTQNIFSNIFKIFPQILEISLTFAKNINSALQHFICTHVNANFAIQYQPQRQFLPVDATFF